MQNRTKAGRMQDGTDRGQSEWRIGQTQDRTHGGQLAGC